MRKIVFVALVFMVILCLVAAISWRRLSAGSDAVPISNALREYQQAAKGSVSGPPRPGVYTYSLSGKECAGLAGIQLCRSFPARAQVILTRKPGSMTLELDLSQDHVEVNRFAIHPDGLYLSWQRTRIVFGIAQDVATAIVPQSLAQPATLSVGQQWTEHFVSGDVSVVTTNRVTRQATMTIGGSPVKTYTIEASSTTSGPHPGTETDITWHAPATGLDTRLVVHRRIGGTFPYTMDAEATLLSLKPLGS